MTRSFSPGGVATAEVADYYRRRAAAEVGLIVSEGTGVDRPASVNVASLGQMTFVVFFLGPPLLGFVAERFGIRTSYWVVVPVLIAALLLIRALPSSQARLNALREPV